MDGSCDVSCKSVQDIEPLQLMQELRIRCVEDGQVIPAHTTVIDSLRKEDNMMQRLKADRGQWAKSLDVKDLTKEKAEVYFHAGCRYSFDEGLWHVGRNGLTLLRDAGIDIGIMGQAEMCCGGRAYELGYEGELIQYASRHEKALNKAGVKTIVTPCSHCYQTMKVLYDKVGQKLGMEVFHITEYLHRLMKEGKIKLSKTVPNSHLSRPLPFGKAGRALIHWNGKETKVLGQMIVHDPPKKFRRGANGVYDIPRDILKSIPGLKVVEMYRMRASSWCCGSGGGVKEAYPDFAIWTAAERIKEAKAVGAEAIVSACPWCTQNFGDAIKETGEKIRVFDVMELVRKSI
jgi:Fe-S oxidoreductase